MSLKRLDLKKRCHIIFESAGNTHFVVQKITLTKSIQNKVLPLNAVSHTSLSRLDLLFSYWLKFQL